MSAPSQALGTGYSLGSYSVWGCVESALDWPLSCPQVLSSALLRFLSPLGASLGICALWGTPSHGPGNPT